MNGIHVYEKKSGLHIGSIFMYKIKIYLWG